MDFRNYLLREAGKLASNQTVKRIELTVQIARLEGRRSLSDAEVAELESLRAENENCAQALRRFGAYHPRRDTEPNCPYCWIIGGESAPLQVSAQTESCQCSKCGAEYP